MASSRADEEDEGISLDIDDIQLLLQAEREQIQKRTFTNWINAQLAKRTPASHVCDLFVDLRDGAVLLDLLEVITGQPMKRQRIPGAFQQKADIETALQFLKDKSVKLVNINIPDITDGKPTVILGLIWSIILHCHIKVMAAYLSSGSNGLSVSSTKIVNSSEQPTQHKECRQSAQRALLSWAQDQCRRAGCSVSVRDFASSWRSGEAFLGILSSLRPDLVDMTQVRSRSNLDNLALAFELAEKELRIPRLLEPQDVDVPDPDEKSMIIFISQFLQFSTTLSSPAFKMEQPLQTPDGFSDDTSPKTHQQLLPVRPKRGPTEAQKAKSRLEKSRVRLLARIRQAAKLFGNKDVTEAERKRKERALKAFDPALLDDFLKAADSYGALCSESQLRDVALQSDSVRKQWEDARAEMSTYIDLLWPKIPQRQLTKADCEEMRQKQEEEPARTGQRECAGVRATLQPLGQPATQEVPQSVTCVMEATARMGSPDAAVGVSESQCTIVPKPHTISSVTLAEPTARQDVRARGEGGQVEAEADGWQRNGAEVNSLEESVDACLQSQPHDLRISESVEGAQISGKAPAVGKAPKRTREVKRGHSLDQKRTALAQKLLELRTSAEELGLQEPTLPALQQRSRALMRLERRLSGLHPELEHIRDTSQPERRDAGLNQGLEELWDETTSAVSERLEQCGLLAELLKRFQKIRGEVGETLQRAEGTLKEHTSYMGRGNLHRLFTKVNETKSELSLVEDKVGELRSVSRQLHGHLQQVSQSDGSIIPFESEADDLMDQWLDISERMESYFENLRFASSLWDCALKLGREAEHWAINKLSTFARSPTFQSEEDVQALQAEVSAQEESAESFGRMAAEIQGLLQTTEPPPELQVGEAQIRKKLAEIKELISEAEDVFRQTEAAKTNVTERMDECSCALQSISQALLKLSGPNPAAVRAKLTEVSQQLQVQDEKVLALEEDLRLLASVGRPGSTATVRDDGRELQRRLKEAHQLFSEVDEQAQKDIRLHDRLRTEVEDLKEWQNKAEATPTAPRENEDVLIQRGTTEALAELMSRLRNSTFRRSPLVEESAKLLERLDNFRSTSGGSRERSESWPAQLRLRAAETPDPQVSQNCGIRGAPRTWRTAGGRPAFAGERGAGLKGEVQMMHGEEDPRSIQPLQSDLQIENAPHLIRSGVTRVPEESPWFELETCLELLKAQLDEASAGGGAVCDEERLGRLLQDVCHRLTSLQRDFSDAQTGTGTGTAKPDSAPQTKVLLQLAAIEDQLSQRLVLLDPNAAISQEICSFLSHKRALDVSVREGQGQEQQAEKHTVYSVVNDQRPVSKKKQAGSGGDGAKDGVETELPQDTRSTLHRSGADHEAPSDLNKWSSVDKVDHSVPHGRPLHSPQNDEGREVQEGKHALTVPKKKWEQQESPVDAIVRNPKGETNEGRTAVRASVEDFTAQRFSREEKHSVEIEEPRAGSDSQAMESANQSREEVLLTADSTNSQKIKHFNDAEGEREEKPRSDSIGSLLRELCKLEFPRSNEATDVDPEETASDMDPERADDPGERPEPGGATGGPHRHKLTMRDVLADVQGSALSNSCIIDREPRFDLSHFLKSSSGDAEIQLMQNIRKVLICRYQAAELSLTAMTSQLQEAERLKCCVEEQVDAIRNEKSDVPKAIDSLCSAALVEASTTVQLKESQTEQVKKCNKQLKMMRGFLQVVTTEKEKMNLDCLGGCELQSEQLAVLLKTMDHKRGLIDECVKSSGQLSVHLSHQDRFGVFMAHFGDIREEWMNLEHSIKTAQQQASNSASQLCAFGQKIKKLKERLKDLLFSLQSVMTLPSYEHTRHLLSWIADVKMHSQRYASFRAQFASISHFCIGQNDKVRLKIDLDELGSLLDECKMKVKVFSRNCGNCSTATYRTLQDFFIRGKQAENHIAAADKLPLFPDDAQNRISEMERFRADHLCRHAQIKDMQFEEKETLPKEEFDRIIQELLELYQRESSSLGQCIRTMKENLKDRENLFDQLSIIDEWLAEIHFQRDYLSQGENVQLDDISAITKQLSVHEEKTSEMEGKLKMVEVVVEGCEKILVGLSPGESRYLVDRLSGVWTEISGLLGLERAVVSELEDCTHRWSNCSKDLSDIETDLERICHALKRQKFPLMQESTSDITLLKHQLTQHQCQVQGIQGCQEWKCSSMLDAIGELRDRCSSLGRCAIEQDKYMLLTKLMEMLRITVSEQIEGANDKEKSLGERFTRCQNLLVELPLVKTQCQEVADQLEAVAQDLHPTELNAERQRICQTVEALVASERAVTHNIKNLESKLILGLRFEDEMPATMELIQRTKQELEEAEAVEPDEKAVDLRLQKCWVSWRNMESAVRVLEGLARKQRKNLRHNEDLYATRNAAMKACLIQMESLSQARESLKDYQWAAQGATGLLQNAAAAFLSSSGGFGDCSEEQRQTEQALDALQAGIQAHLDHLAKVMPQQPCLSRSKMEELHIEMISRLMVRRAVLEAKAQLRIEALQRCSESLQKHKINYESVLREICGIEDNLSKCADDPITSYEQCTARLNRVKLIMEDLQELAERTVELRTSCLTPGCCRGAEVAALWRRLGALRRGVSVLMARTKEKAKEWMDINTSIEQCCALPALIQREPPICPSAVDPVEGSMALPAPAEQHQAELETQQQALASLERRLEHALSRAHSHDPSCTGPVGKTLQEIKDRVSSLQERNRLAVEAVQVKEKESRHIVEELAELECHVLWLSSTLEGYCGQPQQQPKEYKEELSSLQTRLQHIVDRLQSVHREIPLDLCKQLQDVQLSLQRAEGTVTERSTHVEVLAGRVGELRSGLERVKEMLKQKSSSVTEAQHALKRVWDELDLWRGRLMLLENEVQDLAEDLPDQAHFLMDQLTEPLQDYQNTAQRVEQQTAFLSKIPACLRQFDDILYRATCWMDEAESWLGASSSFTTAKSLQSHANSLQLLLEDSERIRLMLQEFRPVLCDISAVCDVSVQDRRLVEADQHVQAMQKTILQPLDALLQTASLVEDLETELKTIERNVTKIEAIYSAEDDDSIPITEQLHNRQVILSSTQSAKEALLEMQGVKEELELPSDTKDKLLVFCKATSLLQKIEELELLSHQQTTALEETFKEKKGSSTSKNPTDWKEAFAMSGSEEDEDDAVSSSDTLTSSVAEEQEEAIKAADPWRVDGAKLMKNDQVIDGLPHDQDSLDTTQSWLLSVRPWLDTGCAENTDSDSESGDLQNFEMTESQKLISSDISAIENQTSVALDKNCRQEACISSSSQAKAGLEDTRLVPVRPITPFTAAVAFEEEEDEHPSLSPSATEIPYKKEERHKEADICLKKVDLCIQEERTREKLSEQICQKLGLDKQQDSQQVSEGEMVSSGVVLQQSHLAVLMLQSIISSGEQGDLLKALKEVMRCLDGLLLTSAHFDNSECALTELRKECVRNELESLCELLNHIELEKDEAVSQCVSSLQQSVSTLNRQLQSQTLLTQQQQVMPNHIVFVDFPDEKQDGLFQDVPVLQCVLLRHLRRSPGAGAGLRQASQSLLQGMSGLVELGEECTTEGRTRTLRSQSELQQALQRLQKLQEVIASQLAFAHYLFQQETLKCHEDEWTQLQVMAGVQRQRALDQRATSHRNLQEWTQWEDNCGQLGRLLDESEAFLGAEQHRGNEAEEVHTRQRIQGCKRLLCELDQSRAALGLLLDQGEHLQMASLGWKGGALELRWKHVYRRAEKDLKYCQDKLENLASFQKDMTSLSQKMICAQEQVQKCSCLAETSNLKPERVRDTMIKLLDLFIEVGVVSAQRESVRRVTSPAFKERLHDLESKCSQLTSALSKTQEFLQKHLLKRWPSDDLLSALEDWLKKKRAHLNEEKVDTVKAKTSADLAKGLQSLKGLQTGLEHGQLLLDFLCQSDPPLVGADAIALRSERTMLAEKLGALRLRWVDLRGELENQIDDTEHMRRVWARRQKKLQHLQNLIERMRKKLDQWKRPHSAFLARRLLLMEWEGHLESLKDIVVNVDELKNANSAVENATEKPLGDAVFGEQVEALGQACEDITQQMDAAKPLLLRTFEMWSHYKKRFNETSLFTARLRCSLRQLHTDPPLSSQHAEKHLHNLQELHLTADISEDSWNTLDKSLKDLVEEVDPAAACFLNEQLEREQKRWKATRRDLTQAVGKAQESVSAWQEFTDLTQRFSLDLQQLWSQWEELQPLTPSHQDIKAQLQEAEDLKDKVVGVKRNLEHHLEASKPLTERLGLTSSSVVLSQTNRLSRDVELLSRASQMHITRLQVEENQQKEFAINLEKLENQTKATEAQMNGVTDVDGAKQVLREMACLFSLVLDVSEMGARVDLSNREAQRLLSVKQRFKEGLTRGSDLYKQLLCQRHRSLDFEGKRKALNDIQEALQREATSGNAGLKQMATFHQKALADIATGNSLLHGLESDAVMLLEKMTPEQRSETLADVSRIRQTWTDVLIVLGQRQFLATQQLTQFTTYLYGRKHLCNVLNDVHALLPPAGPSVCASPLEMHDYENAEKSFQVYTAIYAKTLGAGRTLCELTTDAESQAQLKSEIRALEDAWQCATGQLDKIRDAVQKWKQCQWKIAECQAQLDKCGVKLKEGEPSTPKDSGDIIQETEFSLQHLRTGGLEEVDTMKVDLSPYVPSEDSALLERQIEQLHVQWEDLCAKVSLRKQEIADRLNAWTIFNDKNKEFCDWLTQMENKVGHSADLSFEEMVEKLKKDCMEEINLFSENKRHLKQLGEHLLWASDEAKQSQVHGSLQEANQRWHGLFHHIEARVKELKDTLATVQQLDKNMSNLRSWLCRIEAELSRPITYSVLHPQEIQRRLAEHQELQRDIEQHTDGVASVLNLCDVLLQDKDASNETGADRDSLQETSRSLDQRWRTICAMAVDRRLRIEDTWRLWCKFLDDYSRFEDWLKIAEGTAANPNTGDVPYAAAKEELKKFEGFQRQVNERLTQLELVNNQYRRLSRENRTDRASQLKAMVHEGNRRWDTLQRRVGAILRRLRYFTSQREDFESTRESMLVWLTELDLQLTNVEHFSESDVLHKIQQLNSFQKEITLNTERIDGLIVFGEGLIQRSSPEDAALIEEELEELHSYCQEVFGRLVRFHQRLSQPPVPLEPESPVTSFSLESSLELIGRPWLGRSLSSSLATPTHLLATPLSRSGRDTPVSVDSLPLEWDHTGDVGGSSSHEDDEEEDLDDEGAYFSAVSSRSVCDSPRWRTQEELESDEAPPTLASTPLKQGDYLHLMSQCSGSIEDFKRVSLILGDDEADEFGLTGVNLSGRQSGVIERWELVHAQSQTDLRDDPQEQLPWTLDQISSWLHSVIPRLQTVLLSDPPSTVEDMSTRAKELKEMHRTFAQHKSTMLSLNLSLQGDPEVQHRLASVNQSWSKACTDLQRWDTTLRRTLLRCQEFHETLHSLLLWLAHAESARYAVDIHHPETTLKVLKQHRSTLTDVREELVRRQNQQASLHALWAQLQPDRSDDSDEAQEKLHVTSSKMRTLLRDVTEDLRAIQQRLENEPSPDDQHQRDPAVPAEGVAKGSVKKSDSRERRDPAQSRSFFLRLFRAAFPLHLLLLLLLLLPCLLPVSPPEQSCTVANNFARSFYPMLRYTNGPPPT